MDLEKTAQEKAGGGAQSGDGGAGFTDWYSPSHPSEEQAPAQAAAEAVSAPPPQSPPPPEKRRKNRTGFKVGAVICSVLVLIAASVYAFSEHPAAERRGRDSGSADSHIPSFSTPRPSVPSGDAEDDFRAFFEEYYSAVEEEYSGSRLERAELDASVKLELEDTHGKKELTLKELYETNIDAIVGIKAYRIGQLGMSWGTGVIMTEDGYIITNEHVIDNSDRAVVVTSDFKEYNALLVGEDTETDIAILKIDAEGLTPARFGDSADLSVGDAVVALGNPLGENLVGTMTNGIVSAINRDVSMNGKRMTLIQTNAALNEGNSGGPLINMYGQVIGITNMKMVNRYSEVTIEGIGFAIPSVTVKAMADQLIAGGEITGRPGLGITVGQIPEDAYTQYELPKGLYITAVSPGSDAKEQGIVPGDILTHVNGKQVTTTTDVLAIRDGCVVGDTLTLTIWRDGESFDVDIELLDLNQLY